MLRFHVCEAWEKYVITSIVAEIDPETKCLMDGQFKCPGQDECLQKSQRCNFSPDCEDGQDEEKCRKQTLFWLEVQPRLQAVVGASSAHSSLSLTSCRPEPSSRRHVNKEAYGLSSVH